MLMLLNDFGCCVAATQLCSENYYDPGKRTVWFSYAFKRGLLFSGITSQLFLASPLFYPFKTPEAAELTRSLCLMPILNTANNFLLTNLRIQLENVRFAVINVFQTFIHYLVILPMSYLIGVNGAVFSNYVISLLVLLFSLMVSRKLLCFSWKGGILRSEEKKVFLKLALGSQLNNSAAQTLMLLDVFLIGLIIGDNETISSYKVATTIPSAFAFIPTSIMVYIYPYFAQKNQDRTWVRLRYSKLTLSCAALNFAITLGSILMAPYIIPLLFGHQYTDAIPCFIILMIGYFFNATFQILANNILYTQRKVRINIIITFLSGAINCILDVVLIFHYGAIGAAWATTLVHIITSAFSVAFLYYCLRDTAR